MAKTITSANTIYTLSVSDLFDSPVQLQGFSADNIFTTEPLSSAEIIMGLDGRMSAGFVFVPVIQHVELQADSDSNELFNQWWAASQVAKDVYFAQGVVVLQSIGQTWAMTNGILSSFPPMPDSAKTLRPRRFGLTWQSVSPARTI